MFSIWPQNYLNPRRYCQLLHFQRAQNHAKIWMELYYSWDTWYHMIYVYGSYRYQKQTKITAECKCSIGWERIRQSIKFAASDVFSKKVWDKKDRSENAKWRQIGPIHLKTGSQSMKTTNVVQVIDFLIIQLQWALIKAIIRLEIIFSDKIGRTWSVLSSSKTFESRTPFENASDTANFEKSQIPFRSNGLMQFVNRVKFC